MKIDYRETTKDLQTRIDIHQRFGSRDIDAWMLDLLRPPKGVRILDVACGAGKQLKAFDAHLHGDAQITGGDVSDELLAQARLLNQQTGERWTIERLDFDKRFPHDDETFDLASCCFAIYYAADAAFTIGEMHRVLRPGGRLFTTGPLPENKQLFYDVIREATGKPIPPMPGSSRYGSEILDAIRARFDSVEQHRFENPLRFEELQPFLGYTRASLAEDRRLWTSLFQGGTEFEAVMDKIAMAAGKRLAAQGELVMTKVVGGFIGHKAGGPQVPGEGG
jgi:ubiquinone/menaquinone biosynthesis C-methylase UbiE